MVVVTVSGEEERRTTRKRRALPSRGIGSLELSLTYESAAGLRKSEDADPAVAGDIGGSSRDRVEASGSDAEVIPRLLGGRMACHLGG